MKKELMLVKIYEDSVYGEIEVEAEVGCHNFVFGEDADGQRGMQQIEIDTINYITCLLNGMEEVQEEPKKYIEDIVKSEATERFRSLYHYF